MNDIMKTGNTKKTLCGGVAAGLMLACGVSAATGADYPELPELNWEQRSDWINVKTGMEGIGPAAVGDGVTDDTAALQAAFDKVREPESAFSTVYMPPGTYRITREIYPKHARHDAAMHLRGHGRNTRIVWHGPKGGRMFRSDSAANSTFIGVVWDGRGIAARGFISDSTASMESKVTHQHQAFMNFTEQGSGTAHGKRNANGDFQLYLESSDWRNCLFINCGKGLVFWDFNDYIFTIDGCEFHDNDHGIWSERGNFYVRNSHFRRSRQADIVTHNDAHASSARRVTSIGSRAFYERAGSSGGAIFTMQDCHIDSWSNPGYLIKIGKRASMPLAIFDCRFTNPPTTNPPVRLEASTVLVHSNNPWSTEGPPVGGQAGLVQEIPRGARGGLIGSARQRFFRSSATVPGKVFDAKRDFGALGNGKADDSKAVQNTINAAREHGAGAIAHFPRGTYRVTRTINVTGGNYHVGGSGYSLTTIRGTTSPVVLITDPDNIQLEYIHIRSGGELETAVRQVSTVSAPSRIHYENVAFNFFGRQFVTPDTFTGPGAFEAVGLSKGSILTGWMFQAHLKGISFENCSAARIMLGHVGNHSGGAVRVKGTQTDRSGFFGILTGHTRYRIEDNQSVVASDTYIEQLGMHDWSQGPFIVLRGSSSLPAGRVTIGSPKLSGRNRRTPGPGTDPYEDYFMVDDYRGRLSNMVSDYGNSSKTYDPLKEAFRVICRGTAPLDVLLMGNHYGKGGSGARPVIEGGGNITRSLIANWNGKDPVPNVIDSRSLRLASLALDDFRELGAMDLELNHSMSRRNPAPPQPRK
jgi:hypothetical protein